jgi:hypothetical protein
MSKTSVRAGVMGGVIGGVIGALLVGILSPGLAATGDPLELGTVNLAGRATVLRGPTARNLRIVNTSATGTALDLRVPSGSPPLSVDSSTRVRYLNADKLDGSHAGDFLKLEEFDSNKNLEVDRAEDADTVDGKHSFEFLSRWGKARDSRHADDADTLDGYAPNELIRVTQSSIRNTPDRSGIARQALITAPGPGWLIVSGSVEGRGNTYDIYTCRLLVDGVEVIGSARASTVDIGGPLNTINDEENCSTEGVTSVAAGDHTVALRLDRIGDEVNFGASVVWALYVPFNGQGNVATP